VGIYNRGEINTYFYGYSDLERSKRIDEMTLFEIGSITKTFTAALIMQYHMEGLLDIDDPVEKYLPENTNVPEYQGREITIRHLLTHTSALPREARNEDTSDKPNDYSDFKNLEFNDFLNYYWGLAYPPGTYYSYSNAAYGLLGYVLERLTAQTYSELIEERITNVLRMNDTHTSLKLNSELIERRTLSYDTNQDLLPFSSFGEHQGSGGLVSSINDMMKYMEANLKKDQPLFEIFDACHQLVFKNDQYNYKADIPHMGSGWQIYYYGGDTIVGHTGITNQTSFFRFIKEKQVGVIVLTNTLNPQRTFEIGGEILDLLR
jgi:CubicO group peptidase (beta-lactamase class C family)